MKKYISVRIVSAEPMKAQRPTGKYDKGADGMRIIYEDGIEKWCPIGPFAKTYHKLDTFNDKGMSFEFALALLKEGRKLRRPTWGKDYCELDGGCVKYHRWVGGVPITLHEGFGITDILATDWIIAEEG